ncbi:MAG: methionyl-tRNA formyltransferase [Idiomarina sp.]|nr:methionyl-tRNA formyltransferase [Idiomarina sp.]
MRIVFAGTPEFAATHLTAILEDGRFQVVAVYTQPDRPAGRGKKLQPSAVKQIALAHDIPVEQPENFKSPASQASLAAYQADVMVVVAYGLLLPKTILELPKLGCINVHGSLLPRWRGAAPIQRAIWAGDTHTGVTIMQMDEGLDTGPMLLKQEIQIDPTETSASLYARLATLGPQALLKVLAELQSGASKAEVQNNDEATYAKKLSKEEAQIDWQQPAAFIERCVRAFNPWPGTQFNARDQVFKLWQADVVRGHQRAAAGTILAADKHGIVIQCGQDALCMRLIQPQGKKPMTIQDLLNGRADLFPQGQLLDSHHG